LNKKRLVLRKNHVSISQKKRKENKYNQLDYIFKKKKTVSDE
jgi:hypothetical protein